eukprot:Hpha_TRINITY_DN15479_c5_g13::TRINITY_DN15479_c5_g13_i1::g.173310::m.173310/K10418/DYNLL; dynein light chain LC8-type
MGDRGDDDDEEEVSKVKKVRPPRRIAIKDGDMKPDLESAAVEYIQQGLDDFKMPKDIAQHVKTKMDDDKRGVWHVIVGSHFACNTTHDAGTCINVTVYPIDGQDIGPIGATPVHILMFRNGPPIKSDEQ